MSRDINYIGMDVHKEAEVIAVLNSEWQSQVFAGGIWPVSRIPSCRYLRV
jgi:hypothetical protein